MKYYISAPFGNHLTRPNMYSVMGTFTMYPRPGLFKQIIKTLRYDFHQNGWTNNIGLRNPGIYDGMHKYHLNATRKVVSNHIIIKPQAESAAIDKLITCATKASIGSCRVF